MTPSTLGARKRMVLIPCPRNRLGDTGTLRVQGSQIQSAAIVVGTDEDSGSRLQQSETRLMTPRSGPSSGTRSLSSVPEELQKALCATTVQ